MEPLETEIAEWRTFVTGSGMLGGREVEELESHLRDQITDLTESGLTEDEAFLVAVKRMGNIDEVSREFAVEHSGRLWRQLVVSDEGSDVGFGPWWEAITLAVAAAATIVVVLALGGFPDDEPTWLARNASLIVLPFLAAFFARRRSLPPRSWAIPAAAFVGAGLVVNLFPWSEASSTEVLAAAHLPVVAWFVVAHPYSTGAVGSHGKRMDFVRFTGEWFIYFVLMALGGGVLMGLTAAILEPTGVVDVEVVVPWVLSAGAAGAVVVAGWLVESKQRVIENMAPVLTAIFTPLFALMLAIAAVVYLTTGAWQEFDRELIGVFDALLVVVLGLVLYGLSARGESMEPGWMDRIQLVAVGSALVLDVVVLGAMIARIGDLGFTPNRTAALGLNLVLLLNLARTAWLSARFLRGRGTVAAIERWQTTYLPVFAGWAAVVVVVLPVVFGFD